MNKKPSLNEALRKVDTRASVTTIEPAAPVVSVQTNRVGKKAIIGYFSNDCIRQWKQLALDQDKTLQDLLAEAVNDLFTKNGKAELA